jgi:bis(5'-nucleosyl)-tetraphosphatase (symmetrical)
MATYAIGDVQGCYEPLQRLIQHIRFDPSVDRLWLVGDLVNRGPDSLSVLRYIKNLKDRATVVLGNHDLFLLAVAEQIATVRPEDTIHDIFAAPDREDHLAWLRHQRLFYREGPFAMVHAGLLPQWSVGEAEKLAREVEMSLQGPAYRDTLRSLYPSKHLQWSPNLTGPTRIATIAKVLTRLRACSPDGRMESSYNGPPERIPSGYFPWFQIKDRKHRDTTIVCGHWAALGLHCEEHLLAIDSGCVWGRQLTAVRLEDRKIFQVDCQSIEGVGD